MRVLHLVKTTDGAAWAAAQAASLVRSGIEVHVALPSSTGAMIDAWQQSGAVIHVEDLSLPMMAPWKLTDVCRRMRRLVNRVSPSLIHSHFFTTTMVARMALGHASSMPLLFQVPGPLHLENPIFRNWDLQTARPNDRWIASSLYIANLYRRAGVRHGSVFTSYYGIRTKTITAVRNHRLRTRLGIPKQQYVVGSISHIYAPKYYLGQTRGLKNHERMIEALAHVIRQRSDVTGVLAGGPWQGAERYYTRLKRMAAALGKGRILMPGPLSPSEARASWADYDCVFHIPTSENCGGAIEPLTAGVPVIAARVGALPELVVDGRTGVTISANPTAVATAEAILSVLEDLPKHQHLAQLGGRLASNMFDAERTSAEVAAIYGHVLNPHGCPAPEPFNPASVLDVMEYADACR